ncbi:hypothetical protein BC939DRAFT_3621 [Gamsiella multidivaricata]|uniref:uncharacterized protein n=1 Tax=Gamsiella multidivaricata TaxID=101098 RepID=UPI00221F071C|nr:uncharacterized protein BC939DRAFT_3621 [Gamsiella multidivaricata]KAI7832667.1 hypothetical protein BC939DRAFT_3621 [Gamsiella multidivaricata]
MAVYIRSGADISNYQPADLMKEAWDMEGEYSNAKGPCPARIQDAAAQFIRSIASRAAKDDCRLYGLYQNTLQLVLEQVRYCVLNLEDPREINLVRDLSELRSSKVQKLYSDPSIRNYGWSTLENMDSHWFEISEAVRQDAEGNLQEEDEEDGKDGEQEEQKKEQKEETQYQDQDQKQPRQHASTTSPSPKVQSPSFLTQDPVIFKAHDFKVKYWDSSEESGSEQEFIQKEREDSSPVKTVRRASKPCAAEEKDDTNLQKNKGKGRKEASLPIEGHQGQLLPVQPSASATPATVSSTSTTTAAPSILTASLSSSSKEPFAPSKAPSKPVPARLTPDAVQSMPKTAPPSSDTAPTTSAAAVSSPGSAPAPQSPSAPPPRMEKKEAISLLDRVCRAIGVGSASVKQQSDSEFEDDGDDVPPIVLKPRRVSLPPANPDPKSTIKDDQKKENTERDGSGESQSIRRGTHAVAQFSTSTSALAPDITSTPASLTAPKLAQKSTIRKERRKNRTWTRAEVERLMELVPRFQHRLESGAAAAATGPGQKQRSRKVQWARLKRFDEQNGNILRHRDQVMLKDKYREQTDHGRHRAQVSEILRTKSTNAPRHQFPQQDNQLVQ